MPYSHPSLFVLIQYGRGGGRHPRGGRGADASRYANQGHVTCKQSPPRTEQKWASRLNKLFVRPRILVPAFMSCHAHTQQSFKSPMFVSHCEGVRFFLLTRMSGLRREACLKIPARPTTTIHEPRHAPLTQILAPVSVRAASYSFCALSHPFSHMSSPSK